MTTVVLTLHLLIVISMIGVILLQRSEGGGVGVGSAGGLMGVRGVANFLTRATAVLAALFLVTSLTLAFLTKEISKKERSMLVVKKVSEPPLNQDLEKMEEAQKGVNDSMMEAPVASGD